MEATSTSLPSRGTVPPSAPTNIPGPAPEGECMRIGFLGPLGIFTEQAVQQTAPTGAELVSITSVSHALTALRRGEVDRTVAPIENSIEGDVNATLDSLAYRDPLVIVAETVVPVVFQLVIRPDTQSEDIHKISTHSHAWVRCRNWVEQTFPDAIHAPTASVAADAQLLASGGANFDTVLYPVASADTYEVEPLFRDVADNPGVVTRFVFAVPSRDLPAPAGADKMTVQVALPVNESGALLTLLEQFAVCGVDLSCIEPRPSGGALGDYTFSVDIIDYVVEERVQTALVGLHRCSPEV